MKLIPDFEAARWLYGLSSSSENFDWDAGNRDKNEKHDASWEDIENLLLEKMSFEGRIIEPEYSENRYLALGKDWNGRLLALIFTRRGSKLRPISCRPMRRKERDSYEEKPS